MGDPQSGHRGHGFRRAAAIAMPALAVIMFAAPASAALSTPRLLAAATCSLPDAELQAGLFPDAAKDYAAALADPKSRACARAGLAKLRTEWLGFADVLRRAGLDGQATAAIASALAIRAAAGTRPPQAVLTAQQRIKLASQLAAAGRLDAAATQVELAVQQNPAVTVPPGLRELPSQPEPDGLAEARARAHPIFTVAGIAALGLLGILLLISGLAWLIGRLRRRLLVNAFEAQTTSDGSGLSALVQENIGRLAGSSERGSVDLVSAYSEGVAVPAEVAAVLPQANIIAAILTALGALLPTLNQTMTGTLQTASSDAAGVTLACQHRNGAVRDQQVLWTSDPMVPAQIPGQPEYARFSLPAAIWALWMVRPRLAADLGYDNWESHALTAAGVAAEQAGITDEGDVVAEAIPRTAAPTPAPDPPGPARPAVTRAGAR